MSLGYSNGKFEHIFAYKHKNLEFRRSGFPFENVRGTYEEAEIEQLNGQGSMEVS